MTAISSNPGFALRDQLFGKALPVRPEGGRRSTLGWPEVDHVLGGGLEQGALHEIYADAGHSLAHAAGFAVPLAGLAAAGKPVLWIRPDGWSAEGGRLYPPGLPWMGFDPARLILVRAPDAAAALKAAWEGAKCAALGAVVLEAWDGKGQSLTVSRRLVLAGEASGVTMLLLRSGKVSASAAHTRWRVQPCRSRGLEGGAPGYPAFRVTLLRQRHGPSGQSWEMEWNRETGRFQDRSPFAAPALSRHLVSGPAVGAVRSGDLRRAG